MSQRCALLISVHKVKGQGHNAFITENGLCGVIAFTLHPSSWNFLFFTHILSLPYGFLGQKVNGQGHKALITEINSKICSNDIWVKNMERLNWLQQEIFIQLG